MPCYKTMIAVISSDGLMLGLFTSQVDAWKVAKPVGASMWRCAPNSDVCEKIELKIRTYLGLRILKHTDLDV